MDAELPEHQELVERALDRRRAKFEWLGAVLGAAFSAATAASLAVATVAAQVGAPVVAASAGVAGLALVTVGGTLAVVDGALSGLGGWVRGHPRADLNGAERLLEVGGVLGRAQAADEVVWFWPLAAGARLGARFGRWVHPFPTHGGDHGGRRGGAGSVSDSAHARS